MDIQKTVQAVINTLNQIQVNGEGNMDKLLGCILALKQVKEKLTEPIHADIEVVGVEPIGKENP